MRQDIARGPYKDLFVSGLPQLFRDMRNRASGPLVDPVFGPFTVVPTSFDDESDPNKRDGDDVKVEFVLSPDVGDDAQLSPPTLQDIGGQANALDAEVKKANWHQEPSPQGTTDILSAINGVAFVGQRAIDKVSGTMNDIAFRCEKIVNTVDKITDPKNWPMRRDAIRLRGDALRVARLNESPNQHRTTATVSSRQPLTSVAASLGMTLDQLLILNPQLARNPFVAAGTKLRIPSGAPAPSGFGAFGRL
jgi:hypothetical protein